MGKEIEGMIPPHDIKLEEAVLSAMIVDEQDREEALDVLNEDCFYNSKNQDIYKAIDKLNKSNKPIDIITVTGELSGKVSPYDIVQLCNSAASAMHLIEHSNMLYEFYIRRKIITESIRLQMATYDKSAPIEENSEDFNRLCSALFRHDFSAIRTIGEVSDEVFNIMQKNAIKSDSITGIGTGFYEFDSHSGGLQPTDFVVVAGETSQGKTSFALSIAKNAAMYFNSSVAFYSLEMSNVQLVARLMAQESGVSSKDILTSRLENLEIKRVSERITKLSFAPMYFDDSSSTRLEGILRSIRAMKKKFDIKMVVIDYLQLVTIGDKGLNREQQVGNIARSFKNIAKELNICVMALSQLSREQTKDPRPTLSRLRDSGQIEEAADTIMLIYRPEYYGRTFEEPFKDKDERGAALINVGKGRNIGTFQFLVSFRSSTTSFVDYIGGERVNEDTPF